MIHLATNFNGNGEVQLTLVPEDEDDRQVLKLAFNGRVVKPEFSPSADGSIVLRLEKKKETL